ncbi:DUF6864 domain-containing function [Photobacterium phosphoreum]|uniref:DUF6864 domain-containing function n=1 Tax=Photobacterium phosphoreum TaxID=659 RepID=UPI001E5F7837|nr:hypothetical protein [Photobacterium phosphoreum]MCD9510162.1 hypothetical protein [Photobacterium phosphoreum]
MAFPITVSGRELIDSKQVLLSANDDITVSIEGMTLRFVFENDNNVNGSSYRGNVEGNTFTMSLINFKSSLGEGVLTPLEIGQLNGKRLLISFYVTTMSTQERRFEYNLFSGDKVSD